MLDAALASVKPNTVLDVGCGCGHFTESLCDHCSSIIAIDATPSFMSRWRNLSDRCFIQFCCMDGKNLAFADNTFSAVLERDTLHHIANWRGAIDEMLRVSSKHLLIEEPIDDLRSVEKRNSFDAQGLFLELQREVGYAHYRHIGAEELVSYIERRATVVEVRVEKCDELIPFDKCFDSFSRFAAQSARESYWIERLETYRASLGTGGLCEDDRLLLVATKGFTNHPLRRRHKLA